MIYTKIVCKLINLDDELFVEMKSVLLEKFLDFVVIDKEKLTKEIVCEKVCDYIEKTLIKTDKTIESLVDYYRDSLSNLIEGYIKKKIETKNANGESEEQDTRAYKYFQYAKSTKEKDEDIHMHLEDFSRIMFCLYASIINNKMQVIEDFDLSFTSVKIHTLLGALEYEQKEEKKLFMFTLEGPSKKFDITKKYDRDTFMFIMVILMYYVLKMKEVRSEF